MRFKTLLFLAAFASISDAAIVGLVDDQTGQGVDPDARYPLVNGKAGGQTLTGGTGVNDALTLKGTSANGTSTAVAFKVNVGNNGTTNGLAVLNNGMVGVNRLDPVQPLDVKGNITARNSTTPTSVFAHSSYTDTSNYLKAGIDTVTTPGTAIIGWKGAGTGAGLGSVKFTGTAFDFTNKLLQSGTQVLYLPNQTSFTGSLVVGDGGTNLSHAAGIEGYYNTLVGLNAGGALTTQSSITAIGYDAAKDNTSGNVTVIGRAAAQYNTGLNVTASGYFAAENNTGSSVVAIGLYAARNNTGSNVTVSGDYAAEDNTGSNVTASGDYAAQYNTGSSVMAIGLYAARNNTGSNVTASGYDAAQYNTGPNVTASGYLAARYNAGSNVTAVGADAYNAWTNGAGYAITAADPATEYVTITGHGFGAAGAGIPLKVSGSTIGGLSNGGVYVFVVVDDNTLNLLGGNITSTGTATANKNANAFGNVTALGYNAEPDKSNQVILGDTNVVEVKTFGRLVTEANAIQVNTDRTPASSSDTCVKGAQFSDATYLYKCTATNTIKRIAWSTF